MAKPIAALVLCDIVSHGLKAGAIVEAQPETIKALLALGAVDVAKEAIAHAKANGAPNVRSPLDPAADPSSLAA